MKNFTFESFKQASNKNLFNNDTFNYKNKKKESIVVEGPEDISFYRAYLLNVYDDLYIPNIICVNNGKKEVLKLAKNNLSKVNKYIVDLDYDSKDKLDKCGVISTTGYSMENFYFYIDKDNNNLLKLINMICDDYSMVVRAEDYIEYELMKVLTNYIDNKIYYYAYMKTLHEYNRPFSKNVKEETENYLEVINNELDAYSEFERNKIKSKLEDNISFIKDSKFLFIRGHDLFDLMYEYFTNCKYIDNKKITKKYIYSLAEYLYVPEEFKNKLEK